MTQKYYAILTNQGAARLANAAALGTKLNLTQMGVGDANGVLPTPDPEQTKLINQWRIAPLNQINVDPKNPGQIIAEQMIPEDEGGKWIREIGLYDDDGILIAVANCPETYKPLLQEGSGRTQTIRMILIVSSAAAIALKIDPSVVLATRQYVDSKVIEVRSYVDEKLRAHEQSRNHPDASTTAKGFVQLNSSVTSDSEAQAATAKAVKIAMENANARLAKERNLADLTDPALARQNLVLGGSSTKNVGTIAGTVAAGDDPRITGAMQKKQNGADIEDVAKFLQNLGLKSLAKQDANSVAITGGSAGLGMLNVSNTASFAGEVKYKGLDYLIKDNFVNTPDDKSNSTFGLRLSGQGGQRSDELFYEKIGDYAARRFVVISGGNTITFDMRQNGSMVCLNPNGNWQVHSDGNISGKKWGGYLSEYINNQIATVNAALNNQIDAMNITLNKRITDENTATRNWAAASFPSINYVNQTFMQDSRLGSPTTIYKNNATNVFTCPSGYMFSSIDVGDVGSVTATARPIQKLINNVWITVSQL